MSVSNADTQNEHCLLDDIVPSDSLPASAIMNARAMCECVNCAKIKIALQAKNTNYDKITMELLEECFKSPYTNISGEKIV